MPENRLTKFPPGWAVTLSTPFSYVQQIASPRAARNQFASVPARLLKSGGRLVYATCSLLVRENQQVVDAFLADHPDYELIPVATVLRAQSIDVEHAARFAPYFVMLPHLHGTDGFFAAVFERR